MQQKNAFTLSELLVTITILAILGTIAFISFSSYTSNARDSVRLASIDQINTSLDLFRVYRGKFPEPSNSVDITYSGALVWTQGSFGELTKQQTGKISGSIKDPLYENEYTYSVTANRKEYQLSYLLEGKGENTVSFSAPKIDSMIPQAHAAETFFNPAELSPTIWLDGSDIDGDGATNDNPADGGVITTWVNKGTLGINGNPTVTNGSISYDVDSMNGMPAVFIEKSDGLLLNGSSITQGEIYFVLHDSGGKKNGVGLQATVDKYIIGAYGNYRNSLRINNLPNKLTSSPAVNNTMKAKPYFYSFVTDGINYTFRNSGNIIAGHNNQAVNSIAGITWAFNQAGYRKNVNDLADWGIGEVLIFDSTLSQDERYKVEGYLAHSWALENLLPTNHPYKTDPPTSGPPPPPPDTLPDAFTISDISGAEISTEYISNSFVVSGINLPTSISISGGLYSINGGAYTGTTATVSENNQVRVILTSSSANSTPVSASLNIGGVSESFVVTTKAPAPPPDTSPDQFSFSDITGVNLGSTQVSPSLTITGINAATSINITGGLYKVNGGTFTGATLSVQNNDTIEVQVIASSLYSTPQNATLTIGGISDTFTVTTLSEPPVIERAEVQEKSNVYVEGNYNGMIAYASTGSINYVVSSPSIIASDISITDIDHIMSEHKLVYSGFYNVPSTYTEFGVDLEGGFDFSVFSPIIFEGTKQDLGSYAGLKTVDEGIRSTYRGSIIYSKVSYLLDSYNLNYLENILANNIGLNPIKPFYCRDILDSEFQYNIAQEAIITATPATTWSGVSGTGGIANGIISTEGNLNMEYHSDTPNAFINFEFENPKKIGFVRIFNRADEWSDRLSGATIELYDANLSLVYSHPLWDTTDNYIVDLDLEGLGRLYDVKHLRIASHGNDSYLNLREVEIYVGGDIQNGFYLVDSDGAGGRKPYDVYCDMDTDEGGWTRIQDNHIERGDFSGGFHSPNYDQDWNRENNIVPIQSPVDSGYAMHQRLSIDTSVNAQQNTEYELSLTDKSILDPGQEIRISAWVADAWDEGTNLSGGKGYVFHNRLSYTDGTTAIDGQVETLEEKIVGGKLWKHQMVRIPVEKEVSDFKWYVGYGAETTVSRNFYFTDLRAEIYYR